LIVSLEDVREPGKCRALFFCGIAAALLHLDLSMGRECDILFGPSLL
jgi:hypothetical protein